MRLGPWKIDVEYGHLALVIVIAGVTGFYLADTLQVSRNINNIILVVPLAMLLLGLCLLVVTQCIRFRKHPVQKRATQLPNHERDELEQEQSPMDLLHAFLLLLGVGALVMSYPLIGLDVATLLFMIFALLLLGVRGWLFVPIYAASFTAVVVGGASRLLPYPLPTLLF
ncbi:hypothetical protein LY622_21385 [Halomonas sp. M5N1S17]|uniref:tripartite tricarboxylate transporter TctB family protein n=1 Tax=Halomonas alkalisoli TaxID=2907158 RepID=UPI001F36CB2F|nr:tripartite tricarboxylate transporter TctB family protein [Halomonas alkalisoli]MCE9665987.1 hypothetical protein [Halomonas alkalisoli]